MSRVCVGILALALTCACNSGAGVFGRNIHGLAPGHGPKGGGTNVVIQGSQLYDITSVRLGRARVRRLGHRRSDRVHDRAAWCRGGSRRTTDRPGRTNGQ